jgi:hypothetical protein
LEETVSNEEGLLTRGEASRLLGVTLFEIRRRERLGHLKPVAKEPTHGWDLFRESDVKASCNVEPAKRGRPRKVREEDNKAPTMASSPRAFASAERYVMDDAAVKAFEMLTDGDSLIEIVQAVRIHPRKLEQIAKDFARLQGAILLDKAQVDAINKLPVEGDFPLETSEAIFDAIRLALQEGTCESCHKSLKKVCRPCGRKNAEG